MLSEIYNQCLILPCGCIAYDELVICEGWCCIVPISVPSISIEPVTTGPGVYSSLTIRLGPDCNDRPDKSEDIFVDN